jgi:drug/metabolite transporter (DMT)-like permease
MTAAAALLASVAWGVADFLGGLKSRSVHVLVVLLLAQVFGLVGITFVVAVAGNEPPRSALWAALAGLFGTLGLASFYRGMAVGSISIVAPIAAVGAVVPVVFGIATGDAVTTAHLAGFALALAGVALASFERQEAGAMRIAAGVPWAIAAVIGFGGYYVPMHEASEQDFLWAAFVFRATVGVAAVAAWLTVRPPFQAARGHLVAIAAIGTFDTLGNVLFAAAASRGDVSVVSVLATLYPVTTVALAALVLSERVDRLQLDRLQLVGVASALVGVVLISAA